MSNVILFSLMIATAISIVDNSEERYPCDKAGITFTYPLVEESINVTLGINVYIPCEFIYSPPNRNSSRQSTQRPVPFWRVHYGSGDIQPPSQTLYYGNLPLNHRYNRSGLIISNIDSRFNNATYACCFELLSISPEICEANATTIMIATEKDARATVNIGVRCSGNMTFIIVLFIVYIFVAQGS